MSFSQYEPYGPVVDTTMRCQRLGVRPADQPQLSDHYGVLADLRY